MKKRFDRGSGFFGLLALILILFCANTSDAVTASEVFRENRAKILSDSVTVFEDYTFSKGVATPASESTTSSIYAKRKAKHKAFINLSTYILSKISAARLKIDFTDSISNKLIIKIQQEQAKSIKGDLLRIEGVSKVYSEFDGSHAVVVIAVGNKMLERIRSVKSASFKNESNPRNCASISDFDPFLCYEICPENQLASVRNSISNYLETSYGKNVGRTVDLDPIEDFFEIWETKYKYVGNLDLTDLKSLNREEAFILLNEMPYHPLICFLIAERFKQDGFIRMAKLFYRSGTKLFLTESFLEFNLNINSDQISSGMQERYDYIKTINPMVHEAYRKSDFQFPYKADFIINSLGSIPCYETKTSSRLYYDGNMHFKKKDFEKALQSYLSALEESITADLLNMIGMTLIEMDNSALAIPFLKQAIYLNPNHRFATINLTRALYDSGFKDLALQSYDSAIKNPNLDEWGIYMLRKMKAKLATQS